MTDPMLALAREYAQRRLTYPDTHSGEGAVFSLEDAAELLARFGRMCAEETLAHGYADPEAEDCGDTDGTHLNPKCYEFIADRVRARMKEEKRG